MWPWLRPRYPKPSPTRRTTAFRQPILDYQNTKFVLAECKADVLAGKTLIDHCVQRCIDGTLDAATASMAKLWATEMQCKVVDKCLQIFGGYGYMMEYPIAACTHRRACRRSTAAQTKSSKNLSAARCDGD